MTADDFEEYVRSLGLTAEVLSGEDGNNYSVVPRLRAAERRLARSALRYRDPACRCGPLRGAARHPHPPAPRPHGRERAAEDHGERDRTRLAVLEPTLRSPPDAARPLGAYSHRPLRRPVASGMIDAIALDLSVAMTADYDEALGAHLHKDARQEDLAFAYWRPSVGQDRYTAVITELVLPKAGDRVLHGNVSFLPQYLRRVLADIPEGCGVAFLHGHPHAAWQGMSPRRCGGRARPDCQRRVRPHASAARRAHAGPGMGRGAAGSGSGRRRAPSSAGRPIRSARSAQDSRPPTTRTSPLRQRPPARSLP